jgi:ribonuclease HII
VDPRHLTVVEIGAWLACLKHPGRAVLRRLARDPRRTVRELVVRYERERAAAREERRRIRRLYRAERTRLAVGQIVAGVDEVGRGCLAGPVFAAAVILPDGPEIEGLNDSKQLTPETRACLDVEIRARAVAVAIAEASVEEIDRLNILGASRLAMRRALELLAPAPDFALIDGRDRLPLELEHAAVIRGDALCACIAAASIVAKVARDRFMRDLDHTFPGYGFARHKGYGTAEHLEALARLGRSRIHRSAFLPVAQTALFEYLEDVGRLADPLG